MLKSKIQKIEHIFEQNETVVRLFDEFGVDFNSRIRPLIENALIPNDEILQENTVLALAENPEKKGRAEVTEIIVTGDNSGSLNETWIHLYTPSTSYYIWFNVDSGGTDPAPPNQSTNPQEEIEIDITANESGPSIASKISSALDSTGEFETSISNTYQTVAATSEVTNIECLDDTINGNANYSGRYFRIFDGTDPYVIWFDVENTSTAPSATGTMVEVDITSLDTPEEITTKLFNVIDTLTVFDVVQNVESIDVETVDPGYSTDIDEGTSTQVLNFTILNQGNDTYTRVVSKLKVENTEEGIVLRAKNSDTQSPGFTFTRITLGRDDPISILNEEVSTALGLFPGSIDSPHEENYRNYLSPNGTIYTYFLKWIYFSYKYFNEEQFFFKNLLEHFVPEYDSQIISSTNDLKVYFDGLGILLDTLDQKIEDLYSLGNIDEVDDRFLQHIAQLLGYQKEDFSIKNLSFRELIKNLVEIYQRKGTTYSFKLFFKLLGFEADLREYYWDRDAKNPEGFASINEFNYLYYLTTQDPRTRITTQFETEEDQYAEQPIDVANWTETKDLRMFEELQSDYSLNQILGFVDSDLPYEDRFTYFKTNFINFKLSQFYTKQDLTAKDTDTILKYVKFLTPIYVSAFVEVVTTPWEDTFEWSNPASDDIVIEGNPGDPDWVDILLPFLYVTLKEYIPLNMAPAPENAVIVVQHATTDDDSDGYSDSALPYMFGAPDHGINVSGSVAVNSPVDLSEEKYINLRVDQGRGDKITLQGNTIQTYQQLINRINQKFTQLGIAAEIYSFGVTPNIDIRIRSLEMGTDSKIYLSPGLKNDLFTRLGITLEDPVDGTTGTQGYQSFGLSLTSLTQATGLTPSRDFNLYISVDDDGYVEVDVSGDNPASTSLQEIVGAINNHYSEKNNLKFVTSTKIEDIDTEILTNGKIAIAYRDVSTNNGKIVINNSDGTPNISGINFSRFDCRDVTMSASNDSGLKGFFLAYYDTLNEQLKWTFFNNEGEKEINDRVLEASSAGVQEITSVTLSNNRVALIYSTTTKAWVRLFDISGPSEITTSRIEIYPSAVSYIAASTNQDGFVVTASIGSGGGIIIYLDNNGDFLIGGDSAQSTATFQGSRIISYSSPVETPDEKIFIAYSNDDTGLGSYSGSFAVWNNGSQGSISELVSDTTISNTEISQIDSSITKSGNIIINYVGKNDEYLYNSVFDSDGVLKRKEELYYDDEIVKELESIITTEGDLVTTGVLDNSGLFYRGEYLGNIASITFDDKLELKSIAAGDTWDDSVENYAQASDEGHKFEMEGTEYIYDNYSGYYINQGVDFTDERNRFNTFYETSPNDDLVPLVQDTLTFLFTLIIGSNLFPSENVDKAGFYISRNSYISRSSDPNVVGRGYKGYYTRHQDYSEDIRTDNNRVAREINWPQWKKDSGDKVSEVTNINFNDDTVNGNTNYEGNYFIIYNGLTKFYVWYNLNGNTSKVYLDRSLEIEVQITDTDTTSDVANKTAQAMNNHHIADFSVIANGGSIAVTSNIKGTTEDADTGTLTGVIFISIGIQGSNANTYNDWSSWTMALDYFRPSIERPGYGPQIQKINMSGSAYPAGIYREFVYGVPTGVTAGAWLVEGDPTGKAVIEFQITDPNPSVVWPVNAKISYVEETTGKWKTVATDRSLDGKTLTATVNHFSIWGVIDADTGEVVSDDYTVDIDIDDAKVVRIEEITHGPAGLGTFGGTGAPYGPYQEFTAPTPIGGITTTGISEYEPGVIFFAPDPTGGVTTTGIATYTYLVEYDYTGSGILAIDISIFDPDYLEITIVFDLIGYAVNAGGAAIAKFADYVFVAQGEITATGITEYSYTPIIIAKKPYGWITTGGTGQYTYLPEINYIASGNITITPIVANVKSIITGKVIEYTVITSGEGEYYPSISREAITTPINTDGTYTNFIVENIFIIEIVAIEIDSPPETSTGDLVYSYEYTSSGSVYIYGEISFDYISFEYIGHPTTILFGGTSGNGLLTYVFSGGRSFRKSSYDTSLNTESTNVNNYNSNIIVASHWPYYGDYTSEYVNEKNINKSNLTARIKVGKGYIPYIGFYDAFYEYPSGIYGYGVRFRSKTNYQPGIIYRYQSGPGKVRANGNSIVFINRQIIATIGSIKMKGASHYTLSGNNIYLANVKKIGIRLTTNYSLSSDLYANFEYTSSGLTKVKGYTTYSDGIIHRYTGLGKGFFVKSYPPGVEPPSTEIYLSKVFQNYTPTGAIKATSNHWTKTEAYLEHPEIIKNTNFRWLSVLSGPDNTNMSTWMYDNNIGWTYDDGTGINSTLYNNGNILGAGYKITASKLVRNDIYVFAGENGRISNYKVSTDEWSYYDGSGAQNGPYDDGTLVGEKIISIEAIRKSNLIVFTTTSGKMLNYSLEFGYWTNWDSVSVPTGLKPIPPYSAGTGAGTVYNTKHIVWEKSSKVRLQAMNKVLYRYDSSGKIRVRHPDLDGDIFHITYNIPVNTPKGIITSVEGTYYVRGAAVLSGTSGHTITGMQDGVFYYLPFGDIKTNSPNITGIIEGSVYLYTPIFNRIKITGGNNVQLELWYNDSFYPYYEQIIIMGQSKIYNYTNIGLDRNSFTFSKGEGYGIQPFLSDTTSDVYGAANIDLEISIKPTMFETQSIETIAFYSNNGVFNYNPITGWTKEDGKTLYGKDGSQPNLSYNTSSITSVENYRGNLVFANDAGEIFNYDKHYGWTFSDGTGAGIGIFTEDLLGLGNKINDMDSFYEEYIPLNPTEEEKLCNNCLLVVTGDNGRLGYVFREEKVKYNLNENIGILETYGGYAIEIDRIITITGAKITTGGISGTTILISRSGEGIAISQSGAEYSIEYRYESIGNISTTGSSTHEPEYFYYYTSTGIVILQGSSAFQETGLINYVQTASGDMISGGESTYTLEIIRTGSGQAITNGASAYQETGL
jgi:hypothetical protein